MNPKTLPEWISEMEKLEQEAPYGEVPGCVIERADHKVKCALAMVYELPRAVKIIKRLRTRLISESLNTWTGSDDELVASIDSEIQKILNEGE